MSFEMIDLNKKLKNKYLLKNINIHIDEGSCCGFVGRNGCGKTMLLRAASGYMSAEGTVEWRKEKIGGGKFIKNAGIIIGETDFLHDLSGFENLKILAEINNKVGDERIIEVLQIVGLYENKDKKYRKYSLGMKQRLRIAQAIMEYPDILILDEPFNCLDNKGCAEVRALLENMKHSGITILLTSHNEADIKRLCDKVYEMDNGQIVREVLLNEG